MNRTYSPNKWVILKFTNGEKTFHKILGGWSGGYLDGDSWRLSSGLEKVEEDGDFYLMHNHSGSVYKCHKSMNSMTGLMGSMYSSFKKEAEEANFKLDVVTIEEYLNESKKDVEGS